MWMLLHLKMSVNRGSTEYQQSVTNFRVCMLYNPWDLLTHLPIIRVLPAFMENKSSVNAAIPKFSIHSVST